MRSTLAAVILAVAAASNLWGAACAAPSGEERRTNHNPVKVVADARLPVTTPAGSGLLPLYVSRDWSQPRPEITRAVIVLHGLQRNADVYERSAEEALAKAGDAAANTLLIAPQFLADIDIAAHSLPETTLRWSRDGWEGGEDALGPAAISSFDALDAILARLADRRQFPALRKVVVAGHSGGGQVVQRYAVLGHGEAAFAGSAVTLRYVVANPSSYAYFTPERPVFENGVWNRRFAVPEAAVACPAYNFWKYGMAELPRYAGHTTAAQLEAGYVARDVVYLLGTADTDPNHPVLDRSCMGEAEGPYRYARGTAYVAYLHERDGRALKHVLMPVPGVGHDGRRMFESACGLAALFDTPGCPTR